MFNRTVNHALSNRGDVYKAVQENPGVSYQFLVLMLSLIYGGLLASLPLDVFKDRANYLNYAENSWDILGRYWTISPLVGLTNEPVWLLVNAGLAMVFSPEMVLRLIIFVPASLVAWNVLRQDSRQFIWLLFFLLVPQVVVYHIIGLRQGMAIAVFLVGWFADSRPLRWLMMATAPFIHSSFFFVLALLLVSCVVRRLRLAADLRALLFAGFGLGVGMTLGWVASLLGARQAEIFAFSATDVSGIGFVFWGMVLVIMCLQGRAFLRQHIFETSIIVFYLATYFLTEVTGRIFEAGLLLVLLAGLRLTKWRRMAFLFFIISYTFLQYSFRLNEPWLGFGV